MRDHDALQEFKLAQQEGWNHFAPLEVITTIPAASLVAFAQLAPGARVLDVACGTGVVAISAARQGCQVSGIDLAPALIARAKENSILAEQEIEFQQGDVEALPYKDASFDVVLSQFGHMFAPRAAVALSEMMRVLKPGGQIAFSTWPPEHYVGMMFQLVAQYSEIPTVAVDPPKLWGDPCIVRERLKQYVDDVHFDRGILHMPFLSLGAYCASIEKTLGPIVKLTQQSGMKTALRGFRQDLRKLVASHVKGNTIPQHYLMTRANKRM